MRSVSDDGAIKPSSGAAAHPAMTAAAASMAAVNNGHVARDIRLSSNMSEPGTDENLREARQRADDLGVDPLLPSSLLRRLSKSSLEVLASGGASVKSSSSGAQGFSSTLARVRRPCLPPCRVHRPAYPDLLLLLPSGPRGRDPVGAAQLRHGTAAGCEAPGAAAARRCAPGAAAAAARRCTAQGEAK